MSRFLAKFFQKYFLHQKSYKFYSTCDFFNPRNEFHANRIKFREFKRQNILMHFLPISEVYVPKIEYFHKMKGLKIWKL